MSGVLLCFVTLDTYFYIQYCYTMLLHEKSFHQAPTHTEQLDYNLVIVLIYDYVISMIPVQLFSCILLIVTMRLLSQSMGSVKIHKDQVLKLI